jgi:hypothetical protein
LNCPDTTDIAGYQRHHDVANLTTFFVVKRQSSDLGRARHDASQNMTIVTAFDGCDALLAGKVGH